MKKRLVEKLFRSGLLPDKLRDQRRVLRMYQLFHNQLATLNDNIESKTEQQRFSAFSLLPLELFGALMIDRPDDYKNILKYIPVMADDEVQISWTGSAGHTLMRQSVNFVRIISSTYHNLTQKPLQESKVLDFGCGWGRLIRLFSKYTDPDNIYAVDPWDKSIDLCKEANLPGHYFLSDYLPRTLPTPAGLNFDLIYAFSVYTHLSETATRISLNTLGESLSDNGVLAITVRPREYWDYECSINSAMSSQEAKALIDTHNKDEFAFRPHNRAEVEGEVTYGDSSFSIAYLEKNFPNLKIVGQEWSDIDPYQIMVFLSKRQEN